MTERFSIYPFPRDWHNDHDDGRQYWLAWPWPEPKQPTLWQRLARLLAFLGGRVGSLPPDWRPGRRASAPREGHDQNTSTNVNEEEEYARLRPVYHYPKAR